MADADSLLQLGIFVERNFFDASLCSDLRAIMCSAPANKALVVKDRSYLVDVAQRRTTLASVSASTAAVATRKLLTILPRLESHYSTKLESCASPEFLIYREGDHFRAHADTYPDPKLPPEVHLRKISAVVFLNSQSERLSVDSYSGGYLTFYNLAKNPTWQTYRFKLSGEQGLLVAFPSSVFHEVTPVTRGERFTIVSWFYSSHHDTREANNGANE